MITPSRLIVNQEDDVNITCNSSQPKYVGWLFNDSHHLPVNVWGVGDSIVHINGAQRRLNQGYYECYNINQKFMDALGIVSIFVRGKP